jgi:hypothetical protein
MRYGTCAEIDAMVSGTDAEFDARTRYIKWKSRYRKKHGVEWITPSTRQDHEEPPQQAGASDAPEQSVEETTR